MTDLTDALDKLLQANPGEPFKFKGDQDELTVNFMDRTVVIDSEGTLRESFRDPEPAMKRRVYLTPEEDTPEPEEVLNVEEHNQNLDELLDRLFAEPEAQ